LKFEGLRVFGICGPRLTGKTEFAKALKAWHAKRFVHAEIGPTVGDHDGAAIIDGLTIIEAERLRSVYGRNFTLVYVGCPEFHRRTFKEIDETQAAEPYRGPAFSSCGQIVSNECCLTLLGHKAGKVAADAWTVEA